MRRISPITCQSSTGAANSRMASRTGRRERKLGMGLAVWRPRIMTRRHASRTHSRANRNTRQQCKLFLRTRKLDRRHGAVTCKEVCTKSSTLELVLLCSDIAYRVLNDADLRVTLPRASRGVDGILSTTGGPHFTPRVSRLGYLSGRLTRDVSCRKHVCRTLPSA
jgi:hypothetical protein